jgi:hypothetical protein
LFGADLEEPVSRSRKRDAANRVLTPRRQQKRFKKLAGSIWSAIRLY